MKQKNKKQKTNCAGCIDLHAHSTASDGTVLPSQLSVLAKNVKLRALALTDHDNTDGIEEFMASCKKNDVEGIPGIEISTSWYTSCLHLVGLFIDPSNTHLNELLVEIRRNREVRNFKIIRKLNELGYEITMEELQKASGGIVIGRPHYAAILVRKGYFKENKMVFTKLLGRNKSAYVPRYLPMPDIAIQAIHNAGGIAVWAHPYTFQNVPYSKMRKTCKTLQAWKLDGIECMYSHFSEHERSNATNAAEEFNFLKSGGSDFHGTNNPDVSLGAGMGDLKIPYSFLENMKKRLK